MVNRQDENPGKIHKLVIDAGDCRLVYVVLSIGGFMGMGNKLFAMPWEAFEFSATENKLILNVDKEQLKTTRPLNGVPRVRRGVSIAGRRPGHVAATAYLEVPHETHKVFLLVYELRQNNVSCDGSTLSVYDGGDGHRRVDRDRPPLPLQ